nr:uvrD-like Helicase, ATP-binding domain, P-loop containing nucleoside triphosphate hydrolase [Ipomoea batatas]
MCFFLALLQTLDSANTELRILESKKLFENLLKEKNELIAGWLSEQSALEKIIEGKVAILSEVKCSVDKVMGCLTWMPLEKIIQELEKIQEGHTVEFEAETEKAHLDGNFVKFSCNALTILFFSQNLIYTVWRSTGKKLSIGIISPYTAQVVTIKGTIGRKYDNLNGFAIKAKSIHGFQGGEEDIIIISTVRFNSSGSIGFMNSLQRTNVALTSTRAWYGLSSDLSNLKLTKELDQLDDLLNADSIVFKSQRWKVLLSDNFKRSFKNLVTSRMKKAVLNLLIKLAGGWRPKSKGVDLVCESSSQIVNQFKVEGANTELRILESKKLFENLLKEKNELIAGWLSEQSALELFVDFGK